MRNIGQGNVFATILLGSVLTVFLALYMELS